MRSRCTSWEYDEHVVLDAGGAGAGKEVSNPRLCTPEYLDVVSTVGDFEDKVLLLPHPYTTKLQPGWLQAHSRSVAKFPLLSLTRLHDFLVLP